MKNSKAFLRVALVGAVAVSTIYIASVLATDKPQEQKEIEFLGNLPYNISVVEQFNKNVEEQDKLKVIKGLETIREQHKLKLEEETKQREIIRYEARIKTQRVSRGAVRSVPNTNTSMKTYMDYRKITSKSSPQYKMQQRSDIYTDDEGFRRIGDNFIIAVGTYYGSVGDKLQVKLESGSVFNAIIGDSKANRHTDSANMQHSKDGSVLEFIINSNQLDGMIKRMGDCSHSQANSFKGNVVEIINLSGR